MHVRLGGGSFMRNSIIAVAIGIAAFTVLFAQPASAGDADAVILRPATSWQLDMAESKCRISRLYGEDKDKTAFYLEQWDPSTAASWSVAGPSVEKYRAGRDTRYAFGPDGDDDEFKFIEAKLGEYGNAVSHTSTIAAREFPDEDFDRDHLPTPRGLPSLDSDGAASITTLTLSQKGRDDVVLELGSMKAPLDAMNVCMADLVQHWGLDVEQQKIVYSPPEIKNPVQVAKRVQQHYPSNALWRGGQADFHLRLIINAGGSLGSCVLINQTMAEDFDMRRHPCKAFEDIGEFEPARTATGEPIKSFYATRIVYRVGH